MLATRTGWGYHYDRTSKDLTSRAARVESECLLTKDRSLRLGGGESQPKLKSSVQNQTLDRSGRSGGNQVDR